MQSKAFKLFDLGPVPVWMDASFVVLALLWLGTLIGGPTTIRLAGTSTASYSDSASLVARAPSTFV